MKNGKSPGSDGLTVEFYKTFWDDIKKTFIESINYSFIHGHLTDFQKQSIISLIPKPNKDTTILTNWRPISLLNVDYKIATKAIANRIKKTILNNSTFTNRFHKREIYWGECQTNFRNNRIP